MNALKSVDKCKCIAYQLRLILQEDEKQILQAFGVWTNKLTLPIRRIIQYQRERENYC